MYKDPASAFDLLLQAVAIQRSISGFLGEGVSYLFLARTARAVNCLERSIVLGGWAWKIFRRIENQFNQFIALDDLAACLAALEDKEACHSALNLARHLSLSLGEPAIQKRLDSLRQTFPEFALEAEPAESWLPAIEEALSATLERYEQALAARGEDPLSPLPPPPVSPPEE